MSSGPKDAYEEEKEQRERKLQETFDANKEIQINNVMGAITYLLAFINTNPALTKKQWGCIDQAKKQLEQLFYKGK